MAEEVFQPLPTVPDHPALEEEILAWWEAEGIFEKLRERNRGRPDVLVLRRARDREQDARRPHGLGPDAEGRLPALQGPPGLRPALPERLRLPGPLDRGRRRARARAQLEARDRGVRARGVRRASAATSSSGRRERADAGLEAARAVDGLGQRLLHVQRHEHRVRLADAQARARARLALHGPPLDRVVPALRHVDLAARADAVGRLPGPRRPVALRPLPARSTGRGESRRHLDDDAVDAAGERRRRRQPGRRSTAAARTASGSRSRAIPDETFEETQARLGARRLALPRPVRRRSRRARPSSIASSRGTRSRSTRAPASSTSRRAAAPRTSSSASARACRC